MDIPHRTLTATHPTPARKRRAMEELSMSTSPGLLVRVRRLAAASIDDVAARRPRAAFGGRERALLRGGLAAVGRCLRGGFGAPPREPVGPVREGIPRFL